MNVIRVELTSSGADTCAAANITARSHTPVLSLCRKMIAAGIDPATELEVVRGDTLALTIRNIGEAAKLAVRESGSDGRPRYTPLGDDGWPRKHFPGLSGHNNATTGTSLAPRINSGRVAKYTSMKRCVGTAVLEFLA
jgi:hypothetical protein